MFCTAGSGGLVSALWSSGGSRLGVVRDNCVLVVTVPAWPGVREVQCGEGRTSLATPSPLYSNICQDPAWLWFSPGTAASWLAFVQLTPGDNPDQVPAAGLQVADLSEDTGPVTLVDLTGEERGGGGWLLTSVSWLNSTTLSVSLVSANFSVSVIKLCSQPSFICSQVRREADCHCTMLRKINTRQYFVKSSHLNNNSPSGLHQPR